MKIRLISCRRGCVAFYLIVLLKMENSSGNLATPIFFLLGASLIGNYFFKEDGRVHIQGSEKYNSSEIGKFSNPNRCSSKWVNQFK